MNMFKKQLATAIGLSSLIACGSAAAQPFSFSELIRLGGALPKISEIADDADSSDLDSSSGTITLDDGSKLQLKTVDGRTLRQTLNDSSSTLLVDGNQVKVGTSSSSLLDAYDNSSKTSNFNLTGVVDSRPITVEFQGSPDSLDSSSTFNAKLNGEPVTFELPEGTTLSDFDGNTQFRLRDGSGNLLIDGNLNSLTASEIESIAAKLGVLNADMALRSAQKQFMAQSFGIISTQIDNAMQSRFGAPRGGGASSDLAYTGNTMRGRQEGLNAWVSSEVGDISGKTGNTEYDGSTKAALVGVDQRYGNLLAGISAGYNKVEITNKGNSSGQADLSGNFLAPYGAISLLDDSLVLDGILLYQDLEGQFSSGFNEVELDGDRFGARLSGTYFLPAYGNFQTGLTAGGSYMKDDLDGKTLGTTQDYGIELGEAFTGVKFSNDFGLGRIYGSAIYYEDVTSDVDDSVNTLEDDDHRTELQIGGSHRLGQNMQFNIAAKTTVGSTNTEYTTVQAAMVYQF
jgi:hypothetical protein